MVAKVPQLDLGTWLRHVDIRLRKKAAGAQRPPPGTQQTWVGAHLLQEWGVKGLTWRSR